MAASADGAIFGRAPELAVVRDAVAESAGGSPVYLEFCGVPGAGTTRLGREAAAEAARSGFAVVAARAGTGVRAGSATRGAPFAPFAAALGPSVRGPGGPELVHGLNALALAFGGIDLAEPVALGDPGLERGRLLDAFARVVERLAARGPLAILLDDVHLLDESSRELLHYLAAVLADSTVLLVTTAHPGDADADLHGDRAACAQASWRVHRCELKPLVDADARALLLHAAGRRLDDETLRRAIEHCAGRPLFLVGVGRELARPPLPGRALPMPDELSARVLSHVAMLDEVAHDVVELLAVGGARASDVLDLAAQTPHAAIAAAIDTLTLAGMVETDAGGRFALAHGVLRDAVVAELTPARAHALHLRLARAYEQVAPDGPDRAAELLAAGSGVNVEELASVVLAAARRLLRWGSTDEALRLLAGVAQRCQAMRVSTRAEVQAEYGSALRRAGRSHEARRQWNAAVQDYAQAGDRAGLAVVERELADADWAAGDLDGARARLRAAVDGFAGEEPTDSYAELVHAQAVNAVRVGDAEELRAASDRLEWMADRMRSPLLAGRAALVNGAAALMRTDFVGAETLCARGLAIVAGRGEILLEMRAHDQLAIAAAAQGDMATLRRHSEASAELAAGIPVLIAWPRTRIAIAELTRGDGDAALRMTSDAVDVATRAGEPRSMVAALSAHALVLEHVGRVRAAHAAVVEALQHADDLESDRNVFALVELAEVTVALAEGGAPGAADLWEPEPVRRPDARPRRLRALGDPVAGWLPLIGMAVLGEALARSGHEREVDVLEERVAGILSCRTALPAALAAWLRAWRGSAGEAARADDFDLAGDGFVELGLLRAAARARLESAACLREHSARAVARLRDGAELAGRAGAVAEARRGRALLAEFGETPRERARAGVDSGASDAGALSPRELDVARLVAAGLSNAEVANRLYISPRTVTTHLQHVYARFGFRSRVGLTRYLVDSGLVDSGSVASRPAADT
ncbi:helix-turn-helix transcriptional regulator [Humibacter albus]|uniref:helix-turn-helix transcriptional regulator n=1 Tax=Humibacter albus TaxID=427754 RepID=UPI0003B3868C|nr:LuxR family transcriptional regulator [Humibacter albus]